MEQLFEMGEPGRDDTYTLRNGCAVIYVAGGCFWGTEALMQSIPGVIDATSGYANGTVENPTYEQVCSGATDARETVRVTYDPRVVSLETILHTYFRGIDPTAVNRQGNDRGTQYQAGIYYNDERSMEVVRKVIAIEQERCSPFNVEVKPLSSFFRAEEYHQDYLDKNPGGYCHISPRLFDRASRIVVDAADYAKPSAEALRDALTPLQYRVTQEAGTEPPFSNEYWDFRERGIYVDVVTGEPLFSSVDKYESSCGWPAFDAAIDPNVLIERVDRTHGMVRTEVVSRVGNSHVGHVFSNDPESPNGTRYCIDGAALRFIPYDRMDAEGYGALKPLL